MLPRFCPCQPLSWLETLGVISLVFPLLGMYKEFVSCKSAVTAILYIQTHFLGLQPNNMKSIFFSRQHTYRTEKEASQFLNKLVKYEKTARQKYCWMANFPKTLLWICSPKLQPKNHQLYSSARLSMLTREDIVDTSTRIWTQFYVWKRSLIKMRKSRNDQFHAHNLQSFKKVTSRFKTRITKVFHTVKDNREEFHQKESLQNYILVEKYGVYNIVQSWREQFDSKINWNNLISTQVLA